jgi:hypothetical protein
MQTQMDVETLMEKWTDAALEGAGVQHSGLSEEGQVALAQVLENADTRDVMGHLFEANNTTGTLGGTLNGGADASAYKFRPVSLSLVRRTLPELFANKICGVQAMATPVGLAYAMRSYYEGTEIESGWEQVPVFSGFTGSTRGTSGTADAGTGAVTTSAEAWSTLAVDTTAYPRLQIKVDQKMIEALPRKLAASFSLESIADLRAMLNIDLEKQIVDYMNFEVIAELDREILARCKTAAITSATGGSQLSSAVPYSTSIDISAGLTYDRTGDKIARALNGILFQSEEIAKATKRAPGNIAVCSGRVITMLQGCGSAFTPINTNVNGNQYKPGGISAVGTINGNITVYRDQYATDDYALVAYKGNDAQDSGVIFSPYNMGVQNVAIDPNNFGKIIGVMSRYAITDSLYGSGRYYRSIKFTNTDTVVPGLSS